MTGMTPERLDAIRANLPTPDADLSRRERDALDLLDEVDRLRAENADLRRSRDERKATERRRRTEDREAWMRAQEAEVRDERAKVRYVVFSSDWIEPPGDVIAVFATKAEAMAHIGGPGDGYGWSVVEVPAP